jgi:hypothetical protein
MTLLVGILSAIAASGWAPTVSARLDRGEAHVGDVARMQVTVIHRKDVAVNLPPHPELGKFSLLGVDQAHKDLAGGRTQTDFVLRLAAYELGDLEVPVVQVVATGPDGAIQAIPVGPLPLRIASLLANTPDAQPKAAAAPVRVMERDLRSVWVAAIVAGAALVVAATLWLRRRLVEGRRRARPPAPPEPAHIVALRRLADLRDSGLLERGEVGKFYELLSLAVRDYLGGRYGFDALDMTSLEIGGALVRAQPAAPAPAEVEGFLSACDLVKFARHRPDADVARGALDEAVQLVERTRPAEVQAVAA